MSMKALSAYAKTEKVIESCLTREQVNTAAWVAKRLYRKYPLTLTELPCLRGNARRKRIYLRTKGD